MSFKRSFSMSGGSQVSQDPGLKRSRTIRPGSASRAPARRTFKSVKAVRGTAKLTAAKVRAIVKREIKANQEVKYIDDSYTGQNVAQVFVDASGHSTLSVTMTPAQGTATNQRIGDSILLDTLTLNGNMWQMSNFGSAINLTHYVVAFLGSNPAIVIADFLDGDKALSDLNGGALIYDRNSFRDPDHTGSVKVLGSWNNTVRGEMALEGTGASFPHTGFQQVIDLKGMRCEFDGVSGAKANVNLAVITVADAGNRSGSASTLSGLPTNAGSTGVLFNMMSRLTYRDA